MFSKPRGWASTALLKRVLPGVLLAAAAALPTMALAKTKTITAVMHSDLRVIDPLLTTAYITLDHGYMVYDTLLATDSNFKVQPQMADWKVSDDKLTYTFTLRDGLKWHDGQPVRAVDCVASLERWGKRDTLGQILWEQMVLGYPEEGVRFGGSAADYAAFATGNGAFGAKIGKPTDLPEAIRQALAHPGPALLDVNVNPDEPPMPGKVGYDQAKNFAAAFLHGQQRRATIASTLFRDKIEQLKP